MAEPNTLARPYAKAIFSLVNCSQLFNQWLELLQLLVIIVTDNNAQKIINDQTISADIKANFIIELAGNKIQPSGKNLVKILTQNSRLKLLTEITSMFKNLQQAEQKKLSVTVKAANQIPIIAEKKLLAALNKKFAKDIELNFIEDKNLLAGVKIHAQDNVIDFSMHGQLEKLRKVLKG